MSFLSLQHIGFSQGHRAVIEDISLVQEEGEKLAIAGATGSGKTTLLKLIAGWLQPHKGSIRFRGNILKGPGEQLIPGHPEIAFLSQHFELRNNYSVEEMLDLKNRQDVKDTGRILEWCRIAHLLERKTTEISGGERQRIALAALLLSKPRLLLLDEPFSNLDAIHTAVLKKAIEDIRLEMGVTCLLVSHEARDVLSWADRIIIINQGRVVQQGRPEYIYHHPDDDYVAELFGAYNKRAGLLKDLFPGTTGQIIRPELISIQPQGIPAVVKECYFMGSYYEIHAGEVILYHHERIGIGERIFLAPKR